MKKEGEEGILERVQLINLPANGSAARAASATSSIASVVRERSAIKPDGRLGGAAAVMGATMGNTTAKDPAAAPAAKGIVCQYTGFTC